MASQPGRLARLALYGAPLALALALALPAARATRAGACEPSSWQDWHVAMRSQCLTPAFVCENMTTPRMLADPDVAASYRRALTRGLDGYDALAELVGQMRESYGCDPEAAAAPLVRPPGAGAPPRGVPDDEVHRGLRGAPREGPMRLPPGHPPLTFDERRSVTL